MEWCCACPSQRQHGPDLRPALRWRWAAQSYLEAGQVFVGECVSMAAMSRQRLDQVDQTRADLDALDAQYNRVLNELEVRGGAAVWGSGVRG